MPSRPPRNRPASGALAAALVVVPLCGFAASCVQGPERKFPENAFSHREHPSQVAGCELCHGPVGDGSRVLPKGDLCTRCHPEAAEKQWMPNPARLDRERVVGMFHHVSHIASAKAQRLPADRCTDCHVGMEASDWSSPYSLPAMDDCMRCHRQVTTQQGRAGTDCGVCHTPGDFRGPQQEAIRAALLAGKNQDEIDRAAIPESHLKYMTAPDDAGGSSGDGGR